MGKEQVTTRWPCAHGPTVRLSKGEFLTLTKNICREKSGWTAVNMKNQHRGTVVTLVVLANSL
jgi:hypothetical protein